MLARVLFGALLGSALAEYVVDDDVVILTADNFQTQVLDSDSPWLVEFYAPWCGHCKNLEPEWKKAATALKGLVKVGALDMTEHGDVGKDYGVTGFPTLKVFGVDKTSPSDYQGGRTAKDVAVGGLKVIKELVRSRLGLKKTKKTKTPKAVVKLTADNFQSEVMESEELWLVEFYAPWCGHCKNLAPHWEKAAAQLQGKAKLGAVDATVHGALGSKYEVTGYPTIKVFPQGEKGDAEDFKGGRTAESIVQEVSSLLGEEPEPVEPEDMGAVVVLTADNFKEEVLDSDDVVLVEFFAPWCGHCKQLAPEWKQAAGELEGTAKLAAVDCTAHQSVCGDYEVNSYPTIKVFSPGAKEAPSDYEDARTASGIVRFASDLADAYANPPVALQLTSQESIDEACGSKSLCLVAFLPHILDSGADGRQVYLDLLTGLALKHTKSPIGYVWSEAMAQPAFEEVLGAGGAGYPDLAVVSLKKERAARFSGQFSADGLDDFVKGLMKGKIKTFSVAAFPPVVAIDAWDGQDGVAPKEEL